MTALYPSTSAAQFVIAYPSLRSTTGASAPISVNYVTTPADLALVILDSVGATVCSALLNALPAGITAQLTGSRVAFINVASTAFTVAGQYAAYLSYVADPNYATTLASFQWGGWIDTLIANTTSTEALVSSPSYWATNRVDVDDVAAPTELILYDSDGTTPLATRSIANADGSAVNPAQVLILGALTPVP